jgi:tripartite-type tricarboxylate transporter receptor subunit TctC
VIPAALPARTLQEFVAYSKSNANKLSYGSTGMGSPQHIAMEMLKLSTGADLLHVPYKGGPQAVGDVAAGQIQATWNTISVVEPFVKSGLLRALAVGGAARSAVLPDVPTLREAGVKDFEYVPWIGFYGPPRMSDAAVKRLNAGVQETLKEAAVIERLTAVGLEARPMSLAAFEKHGISERAEMAGVLERMKLT